MTERSAQVNQKRPDDSVALFLPQAHCLFGGPALLPTPSRAIWSAQKGLWLILWMAVWKNSDTAGSWTALSVRPPAATALNSIFLRAQKFPWLRRISNQAG